MVSASYAATASTVPLPGSFTFTLDGAGTAISLGSKKTFAADFGGILTGWTMYSLPSDQSASIYIDVYKTTYASYPPVAANKITGTGNVPFILSGSKNTTSSVAGWGTQSFANGDIFGLNVDSNDVATWAQLKLHYLR